MKTPKENDRDRYVQDRYRDVIDYYWTASSSNKNWYKSTRSLTVILGALVTLIASLASSEMIGQSPVAEPVFAFGTPILAALLTIISGFSQNFQWGSAWQNMVLTAQYLQKEFDKYLVTPEDERNFSEETEKLNAFVINETEGFFERMLGGAKPRSSKPEPSSS